MCEGQNYFVRRFALHAYDTSSSFGLIYPNVCMTTNAPAQDSPSPEKGGPIEYVAALLLRTVMRIITAARGWAMQIF